MKIVVLSGAGISAESGIKTFRDADGLWEGHDVMEVASPQGWQANQDLVLDFYNQRRKQLLEVEPNRAHKALADLEDHHEVHIVTQNVDDLHERAGSTQVLHLHGELFKVRSEGNPTDILEWKKDLKTGDKCPSGHQYRPHIVWFGEAVPMLEKAAEIVSHADVLVIVGTSLQVYPAAGLISYAPESAKVYYLDPKPFISRELELRKHHIIAKLATEGMPEMVEILTS